MNVREAVLWFVLLALVVFLGWMMWSPAQQPAAGDRVSFGEFLSRVDAGKVAKVRIADQDLVATTKSDTTFVTRAPEDSRLYLPKLLERGVTVTVVQPSSHGPAVQLLLLYTSTVLPWFTLLLVVLAYLRVRTLEKQVAALRGEGEDRS